MSIDGPLKKQQQQEPSLQCMLNDKKCYNASQKQKRTEENKNHLGFSAHYHYQSNK